MNAKPSQVASSGSLGVAGVVEGAGAGLIFIGAYVPWVVTFVLVTTVSVRGVDTDYGRILTLIPLLALGLLAWRWYARRGRWVHVGIIALGILAIALALVYAVGVKRNLSRVQQSLARAGPMLPGNYRVGFDLGLYLTLAGGAAMVGGGALELHQDQALLRQE